MSREDPTRREFLLKLARGAGYSAPLVATFAVAPALLAQGGSPPGHHGHHPQAVPEPAPSPSPGAPPPSERHPPPSKQPE